MAIRAVIVDEDYDMVKMLSELLELENIQVVGMGYDGKEAVQQYKKTKPDVILVDLKMPIYDGYFALQKIKKMDPRAKVVIVTGDTHTDSKENLEELGAAAIVYKNEDLYHLPQTIEKLCKKGFLAQVMKSFNKGNEDI